MNFAGIRIGLADSQPNDAAPSDAIPLSSERMRRADYILFYRKSNSMSRLVFI
jgi:hypothetical protein